MKDTRKISILLPFFNEEKYIISCLESIQQQTYSNWEVIAVDDGSTDDSPNLVKEIAEKDDRVKYLLNRGKGVISALQNALKESTGKLISRMDGDDIKSLDNLSTMATLLTKRGIVATGMVHYFSDEPEGVQGGYARYEDWINTAIKEEACFRQVYKECTIPSPCWLIHRDDLDKSGAFQSDLYPEDYDLILRFHKAGMEVRSVRKVIHYWRDHAHRVTRNDERYADNFFIDLKLPYFLDIELDKSSELVLWSAGRKAKEIAKRLVDKSISFRWLCNNERKIGLDIYGVRVEDQSNYRFDQRHKIIIAVSSPDDQADIQEELNSWGVQEGRDYWWFC